MKYGALESPYHEANEFLSKYVVGKDDPSNKLGKAHVRPLRDDEELPKGISHKAMSDNSGILGVNGRHVYWNLDENGDISFPFLDERERKKASELFNREIDDEMRKLAEKHPDHAWARDFLNPKPDDEGKFTRDSANGLGLKYRPRNKL